MKESSRQWGWHVNRAGVSPIVCLISSRIFYAKGLKLERIIYFIASGGYMPTCLDLTTTNDAQTARSGLYSDLRPQHYATYLKHFLLMTKQVSINVCSRDLLTMLSSGMRRECVFFILMF